MEIIVLLQNLSNQFTLHYMTLAEILKYAKDKYGNDVSVANVHYDVEGLIRKSSIFDVVRCK